MPRRKAKSSAFEFTGEEAVLAEQAFKKRHRFVRKPRISVTSISPRASIEKLHFRKAPTEPVPISSPRKWKRDAQKRAKTGAKLEELKMHGKKVASKTANVVTPPSSRANPASTASTPTSTPSRRSRRRKLPSFKLRLSSSSDHFLHSDANPPSEQPSPEKNHASEQEGFRDSPLGEERKRPREEPDDRGKNAAVVVKRPRSDRSNDSAEIAKHSEAPEGEKSEADVSQPATTEDLDKEARNESGESADTRGEGKEVSHAGDGDLKNAAVHLARNVTEDAAKGAKHVEEEAEKSQRDSGEAVPAGDLAEKEENEKVEEEEEKDRGKEMSLTEVTAAKDNVISAEVEQPTAVIPVDGASSSPERSPSADKICLVEASPSESCPKSDSKPSFESPLTPLRSDQDAQMFDDTPVGLPPGRPPCNDDDEGATKLDNMDHTVPISLSTAGAEITIEKQTTSTYATPETARMPDEQELIADDPLPSPAEISVICEEADDEGHTITNTCAPSDGISEQEPEDAQLASVQKDEIKEERESREQEAEISLPEASNTPASDAKAEPTDQAKALSTAMKRVRFTELPPSYRSGKDKMGFSGIMRMRRKKVRRHRAVGMGSSDVSVASAGTKGPDQKNRQMLLDELQYLLDGILKTTTNGSKNWLKPNNEVIASSLQALVALLLRKPRTAGRRNEEGEGEDSGELVQILFEQPDLLKTIVKSLCSILGKSRASDALLALVFVIILRSTPKVLLLTEHELDLLLNAFFRNSAASLKEGEKGTANANDSKGKSKEPQARPRGKLGRMLQQKKPSDQVLKPLLKLMKDADVIEDDSDAFKKETDAATHLIGIALSLILRNEVETRAWMRNNRRLDKVVAVLYSCEKMMLSQQAEDNDQDHIPQNNIEEGASWIVMEASMRILEFAVLDQVCQQRLARESRISAILVDLLRTIKSIKTGPQESEWMICAALRLCINICHGCGFASKQFVDGSGHTVVLNCLVKESLAAGLLKESGTYGHCDDVEESFDVRVLCLAVLASVVNQDVTVCDSFHEIQAEVLGKRESGAISLILEILRTAELETKKEEGKDSDEEDDLELRRRKRTTKEEDAARERRAQFVMERKITIGYVCLLIGALASDSRSNRELIQDLMPGKSLIGVAAVLAEFLEFHHEVGVISGSMNRMYADIIKKIAEPDAANEAIVLSTDADDFDRDMKGDAENQIDGLEFLLDSPSGEDEEETRDVSNRRSEEIAVELADERDEVILTTKAEELA